MYIYIVYVLTPYLYVMLSLHRAASPKPCAAGCVEHAAQARLAEGQGERVRQAVDGRLAFPQGRATRRLEVHLRGQAGHEVVGSQPVPGLSASFVLVVCVCVWGERVYCARCLCLKSKSPRVHDYLKCFELQTKIQTPTRNNNIVNEDYSMVLVVRVCCPLRFCV